MIEYVGFQEVCEMAKISKSRFANWRKRGVKNVPEPLAQLKMGPIWEKSVIENWLKTLIKSQP